jgi:uncharacterized coiled-coil protein SlyX
MSTICTQSNMPALAFMRTFLKRYNPAGRVADETGGNQMSNGSNNAAQGVPPKRVMFDGTINIPTILGCLTMVGSTAISCAALYVSFDNRITKLEMQVPTQQAALADIKTETQRNLDRINDKLDRLLESRAGNTPGAREWVRK